MRRDQSFGFLFAAASLAAALCVRGVVNMDQPIANDVHNEELHGLLHSLIGRVHGLNAVLVSSCDGVPLMRVTADEEASDETLAYIQVCCWVWACVCEQASAAEGRFCTQLQDWHVNFRWVLLLCVSASCPPTPPSPPRSPARCRPLSFVPAQTELAAVFAASVKQIASLKLGHVQSLVSEYSRFTVVHVDGTQLVITFVAAKDANVALIQQLAPQVKKALSHFAEQIAY